MYGCINTRFRMYVNYLPKSVVTMVDEGSISVEKKYEIYFRDVFRVLNAVHESDCLSRSGHFT